MFLTMLLVDFFHEDWSARCCELRSQDEPFMVLTGDYRPLPVGATGLEIGAEVIDGDGWTIRRDRPCDPVDKWRDRSDEYVKFEIRHSGVTPPMAGVGAYNLVLPPGWRFDVLVVDNPNYSGSKYMVARDNEGKREAVMLYFEGANTRFNLAIQAARDSRASDSHELGTSVCSRNIVEPSPMDTDTQTVLTDARTDSWPTIAPQSKPFSAVGMDVQDASASQTHALVKGEIEIGRREEKGQELRDSNTIFSASSQSQARSASIQPTGAWKSNQDADREIGTSEVLPLPTAADFYTQIAPIIEQFTSLEGPPDPPRRVTGSTVFRWNVEMATWIRDVEAVLDAAYRTAKTREREGFPSVELAQMAADARAGLRELRNLIRQPPELIDWKLDPAIPQGIWENVAGVVALAANS